MSLFSLRSILPLRRSTAQAACGSWRSCSSLHSFIEPPRRVYNHYPHICNPSLLQSRKMSNGSTSEMPAFADSDSNRIVWVDCEMTGLDPDVDTLLEIAVIITDGDLNLLAEGPSLIIHHPDQVLANMGEWCVKQHGESGLTEAVKNSQLGMKECEDLVLEFVKKWTPPRKCPLGGNSIGQDAKFLCKYMPNLMSHLHYRIIDVSTVKELAQRWSPDVLANAPKKSFSHRALDDIRASIAELKYYKEKFFKQI